MKYNGYEVKSLNNYYELTEELRKRFYKYPTEDDVKNCSDEYLLGWYRFLPIPKNSYQESISKMIVSECKYRFMTEHNEFNNQTTNTYNNYNKTYRPNYYKYNNTNNYNNIYSNKPSFKTYNNTNRNFVRQSNTGNNTNK